MLNIQETLLDETFEIGESQSLRGAWWVWIQKNARVVLQIIDRINLNPNNFSANFHQNRKSSSYFERFKRF